MTTYQEDRIGARIRTLGDDLEGMRRIVGHGDLLAFPQMQHQCGIFSPYQSQGWFYSCYFRWLCRW